MGDEQAGVPKPVCGCKSYPAAGVVRDYCFFSYGNLRGKIPLGFSFFRASETRGRMIGRTWGRLYLGTRNHRKIKTLRRRHPGSWKTFYVLLEMAFETNDDSWIFIESGQPYPIGELADEGAASPSSRGTTTAAGGLTWSSW